MSKLGDIFQAVRRASGWIFCPFRMAENSNLLAANETLASQVKSLGHERDKYYLQAHTDHGLTGLPNRAAANVYIQSIYGDLADKIDSEDTNPDEEGVIVLSLDADCFKFINDKFGHKGGDFVLNFISSGLEFCLRQQSNEEVYAGDLRSFGDFIARGEAELEANSMPADEQVDFSDTSKKIAARDGGEEFVCILPTKMKPNIKTMRKIAKRVSEGVSGECRLPTEEICHVSVSLGLKFLSLRQLEDILIDIPLGSTTKELMTQVRLGVFDAADRESYKAKEAGRACASYEGQIIYVYPGKLSDAVIAKRKEMHIGKPVVAAAVLAAGQS